MEATNNNEILGFIVLLRQHAKFSRETDFDDDRTCKMVYVFVCVFVRVEQKNIYKAITLLQSVCVRVCVY